MCPIPGEKVFCYGNFFWVCKGLTFTVDRFNKVQILPSGKPNNDLSLVCFNNAIYAIGGLKNLSEKFSLRKNKWKSLCSLPSGNYKHSSSLVFMDTILIAAEHCREIVNYYVKWDNFEVLYSPILNNSTCKKLFSAEGRAFVVEASESLYESSIGDISKWNYVMRNSLRNTYFVSFEVFFNNDVYFLNRWSRLIKFDTKLKDFCKCEFT